MASYLYIFPWPLNGSMALTSRAILLTSGISSRQWLGIQHIMKTSLTIWKKRAIKGTYSFFLSFLSCSKFCFPSFLKLKFFPPFLSSFRTFSFSHLHLWSYSSTPVQQLTFNIFWQFLCWFHDLFIYLFTYLFI